MNPGKPLHYSVIKGTREVMLRITKFYHIGQRTLYSCYLVQKVHGGLESHMWQRRHGEVAEIPYPKMIIQLVH